MEKESQKRQPKGKTGLIHGVAPCISSSTLRQPIKDKRRQATSPPLKATPGPHSLPAGKSGEVALASSENWMPEFMMNWLHSRLLLCFLIIIPAGAQAADDPAALQAARDRIMGPPIASTPAYTVHSPQAKKSGATFRCGEPAAMNAVTLYFQHTPSDPDQTLVPLQGLAPTAAFVSELNALLRQFLSTCPDTEWVSSAHYYRDLIPHGMVVTDRLEPHIIAFRFILRSGVLSLKPAQTLSEVQKINNDPARNPRLTLAGLRAENAAMSGEAARRSGAYRSEHAVAANRRPGVVYKLDPYWSRYRKPDLARRIFDGDFGLDSESAGMTHGGGRRYAETAEFRMLYINYADLFSQRCQAQVKSWATLAEQTRVNHRSELNPVTGVFESKSDPKTVTRRIDARFAGLYPRYEADLQGTQIANTLNQMRAAERGERQRPSDMSAADFNAAVKQQMSDMMDLAGIFPDFFDNHTCTSAAMMQMGENILRASLGQRSLQADGVTLANAAQESDPP